MKTVSEEIKRDDVRVAELDEQMKQFLLTIPNIPHSSVPIGHGAADNVEVRRMGAPPKFDFAPRPHWEVGESAGDSRFSGRRENRGRCGRRLQKDFRRAARTRHRKFLSRRAHARARLHGNPSTVHRQHRRAHRRWASFRNSPPICFTSKARTCGLRPRPRWN